ncbi:hypothetical protein FRC12_011546 [Ceratobasidium sp. 428]|nr:hypothetical protein FRC12_011546 [Ceratobasidium sp. 428]
MSNNLIHPEALVTPYFVAKYQGRAVAIKRNESYEATIQHLQKSIPKLRSTDIQDIFMATTLPDYGDALIQISEDMWPGFVGWVKEVEVTMEDPNEVDDTVGPRPSGANADLGSVGAQVQVTPTQVISSDATITVNSFGPISLTILTTSQISFTLNDLPRSTTIGQIKSRIEAEQDIPADLQNLEFLGGPLQDHMTLLQCGLVNDSVLSLFLDTKRQTVICFPQAQKPPYENITLQIQLNRSWELMTLHPSVQTPSEDRVQTMLWNVDVTGYGEIYDRHSGQKVRCLLWDGISARLPTPSDPPQPNVLQDQSLDRAAMHSSMIAVQPGNSVVVPINHAHSYISRVCGRRFSFVYTAPDFLTQRFCKWPKSSSYTHVALRFLSQADYQSIEPLTVSQGSNVYVYRLLVLCRRLSHPAALIWGTVHPLYYENSVVTSWDEIIESQPIIKGSGYPPLSALEVTCIEVS